MIDRSKKRSNDIVGSSIFKEIFKDVKRKKETAGHRSKEV